MFKFDNVIIFGDIHGNIGEVINFYKKYNLTNSLFIGCGDFGIGFAKNEYKELKQLAYYDSSLKANNNFIYSIRGNHDNPKYFNNINYGNIKLIKDYSVVNINELNFLFIGGAISIDRKPNPLFYDPITNSSYKGRKLNVNYWENEKIIFKPELLNFDCNIDAVITHSAPSFCYPYNNNNLTEWFKSDEALLKDITEERNILSNIYKILRVKNEIKYWFYGHFHSSFSNFVNETNFRVLNVNEFFELKELRNYE